MDGESGIKHNEARRRARVLIVDDMRINIELLTAVLRQEYDVDSAESGALALERLRQQDKPDLILLDIVMPDIDGYEVCRHIKENPETRHIPVIFITAKDQISDQQRGFDLGAADYITKPFNVSLVLARVNVHVRLKLKSEKLEMLAFFDGLTDIPNRRSLEEELDKEIRRAKRSGTVLSVLMIDVDHFKLYNDHYGHGAGDECLRRVAHELEGGLMRAGDFIGRYGGEEFTVVLPCCDCVDALAIGEILRQKIYDLNLPHASSPVADRVTLSIGASGCAPEREASWNDLLKEADRALYQAKVQGRNRVCAHECIVPGVKV